MSKKQSDSAALVAAKAVMKRMLETPPTPHEVKGNGKRKSTRQGKRK